MYLRIIDRVEKKDFLFSGYDSNKVGFCSWSQSPDLAQNIPENDCQELVKFLILNGIYDTKRFKFEISKDCKMLSHFRKYY